MKKISPRPFSVHPTDACKLPIFFSGSLSALIISELTLKITHSVSTTRNGRQLASLGWINRFETKGMQAVITSQVTWKGSIQYLCFAPLTRTQGYDSICLPWFMDRWIGSGNFLAIRTVRFGPLGNVEARRGSWVGDEAVPEACLYSSHLISASPS